MFCLKTDGLLAPLLAGFARRHEEQEEHSASVNCFIGLNPVDSENWKTKSVVGKIYEIFKVCTFTKWFICCKKRQCPKLRGKR